MATTLTSTGLTHNDGTTPSTRSRIKAWCEINTAATVLVKSYNISGTSDLGVGYWSVSWTPDGSSGNYAAAGIASEDDQTGAAAVCSVFFNNPGTGVTAGSCAVRTCTESGAATDSNYLRLVIFF